MKNFIQDNRFQANKLQTHVDVEQSTLEAIASNMAYAEIDYMDGDLDVVRKIKFFNGEELIVATLFDIDGKYNILVINSDFLIKRFISKFKGERK